MAFKKIYAYLSLMRLNKPVGILLLLWPTLWALWIAASGLPNLHILSVFVLGAILMRSAGCVVNDISDMHIDGLVERTKNRPLIQQLITKKSALTLALALSLIAFGLVCTLNTLSINLSFVAIFLAFSYPFTKRFFHLPQAYLGIAFGFGIPMAFAAQQNIIPDIAWILMLANIFWAIAYDTEYAMVDREDDLKIGIYSSAITFGRFDVMAVMFCYGLTLSIMCYVGIEMKFGAIYFIALLAGFLLTIYHYYLIRHRKKTQCFKAFSGNVWFGGLIFFGIYLNYLSR